MKNTTVWKCTWATWTSWAPHGPSGCVLLSDVSTFHFKKWKYLPSSTDDCHWKFSVCRWWLSWEWYVWLSSSSSLVRCCKTLKYMSKYTHVQFHMLIHPNSLPLSSPPQSTSAPKKSCSYPSLISTSLIYTRKNKQTNPQIDSKIIHEKIPSIDVYLVPISLDITPLSGPHGSPTSTTSPLDPCLYLSCECVALSPFWVLSAFLTCHDWEPNTRDDATTEKETMIGDNCYITDEYIYSSL